MKKTLLFFSFILLLSFGVHKYYISLTQIEYVSEQKSLQIITSVFIDDYELALQKSFDPKIQIDKINKTKLDSLSAIYLKKHLVIEINDKTVEQSYIASELDQDEIFFYVEGKDVESFKSMSVDNDILMEIYSQQENIIKTKVAGKFKSKIVTIKKPKALLNY
ncbi:MAG: DUF6702 family protein [Flavobacteriaceae bacterium]